MNKERRKARLIITSSIIGGIIGAFLNSLNNNFTLWKMISFILLLILIEYFLIKEIKYDQI